MTPGGVDQLIGNVREEISDEIDIEFREIEIWDTYIIPNPINQSFTFLQRSILPRDDIRKNLTVSATSIGSHVVPASP